MCTKKTVLYACRIRPHTILKILYTVLTRCPSAFAISLAYATLIPQTRRFSKRTFDHKPVHLQANNTKHRGRSSDLFRLERLPNFLSGDLTPNTYPRKDRNLQQQVLFRILTEFPFHPSCQTLRGTICVAKIVNNSFTLPFLYLFFEKTLSI